MTQPQGAQRMTRSPTLLAYCHGYRAAYLRAANLTLGIPFMPCVLSQAQQGEWLVGFVDAAADMLVRPKPRFEPDVVLVMERAR